MASSDKRRPVIFLGVGIFNTLVDFAFYSLLTMTIFRSHAQIGTAGLASGTVALLCALLTHSLITWRGSSISRQTVLKFIAFTGFGMWVLRPLLLAFFIKLTGLYSWAYGVSHGLHLPFSYDFVAHTGAFGFMAVIVLLYNYLVYDRFVFKPSGAASSLSSSGSSKASSLPEPQEPPAHTDPGTHSAS